MALDNRDKDQVKEFFEMGGYGYYIYVAYGCVLTFLFVMWFIPWRKRRRIKKISSESQIVFRQLREKLKF